MIQYYIMSCELVKLRGGERNNFHSTLVCGACYEIIEIFIKLIKIGCARRRQSKHLGQQIPDS